MFASTYRPYPTYSVVPKNATLDEIGEAALRYVIAEGTASTLTTRELEQAQRVGNAAVVGYGKEGTQALENIQSARMIITQTLSWRAEQAALEAAVEQPAEFPLPPEPEPEVPLTDDQLIVAMFKEMLRLAKKRGGSDDNTDGGKKARLKKPKPQLPSGGVALDQRPQ